MSIEESEGIAVRDLLGTAFVGAEPPLRDLASGSIARGDAARRRNRRLAAAGGAVLSVAAVIGTFALVTGATPGGHGNPGPVKQVDTDPPLVKPSGYLGLGPERWGIDKIQDLKNRLAVTLQPLLPAGVGFGQVESRNTPTYVDAMSGILSGPSGTNLATMWVGLASPADTESVIRQLACPKGGTCQTRELDGGTVYVYEQAGAAEDQVIPGSPLHDVLKPGTEKDIVSRTLAMTFVPDDRSKYVFHFVVQAATAPMQFVDHAPADIERGIPWPPASLVMPELDPSGPLVSGDDLVAMLAKPGLDRLEYLLDSRTPVSKDAAAEAAAAEGRLAAAAEAALPAGLTVGVDDSMTEPQLMVTGAKGKNQLYWTAFVLNAQERQQSYGNCSAGDGCTRRTVPGGALEVMAQYPNSASTTPSDNPALDHYVFLPDDLSKPVLNMTLNALPLTPQNSSLSPTASPGRLPMIHGPYAPLLVTPDQFLTAAEDGRLATAITTTKSLLAALE